MPVMRWPALSLILSCHARPQTEAAEEAEPEATNAAPAENSEVEPPPTAEAPPIAPPASLVQRPIVFDTERVELTLRYLQTHNNADLSLDDPQGTFMEPRVVVLHWTAGSSADSAWNIFAPTRLRGRTNLQDAGALNVSAHFIVDRDGTPYQLMETTRIGRHTIGLNHLSIGIENVGDDERWPLTEEQVQTNIDLVRWLASQHEITHLIGHHEYQEMEGHAYFKELDPTYRTVKIDPGDTFVQKVWDGVAELELQRAGSSSDTERP